MVKLKGLPHEILLSVIKIVITRERPTELEIADNVTLLHPKDNAILFTCRLFRELSLPHYDASSELLVKRGGLGNLDSAEAIANITVEYDTDVKAIFDSPELFPNLKHLEWDLTDPDDEIEIENDNKYRIMEPVSWHTLGADPMAIFGFEPSYMRSCMHGGFFNVLDKCRTLKTRVPDIVIVVKFTVDCRHVRCAIHQGIGHELEATYTWKQDSAETLQMEGPPTWTMNNHITEFGGSNDDANRPACQCDSKFMDSDTTQAFRQPAQAPSDVQPVLEFGPP